MICHAGVSPGAARTDFEKSLLFKKYDFLTIGSERRTTMKVRPSVKPICEKCKIIKRKELANLFAAHRAHLNGRHSEIAFPASFVENPPLKHTPPVVKPSSRPGRKLRTQRMIAFPARFDAGVQSQKLDKLRIIELTDRGQLQLQKIVLRRIQIKRKNACRITQKKMERSIAAARDATDRVRRRDVQSF